MSYCETLCCAGICNITNNTKCATCRLGKLNIVLDLDETLIHATHLNFGNAFCKFEIYNIYKRPHLDKFLAIVFEKYNVYIWTAACKSYAKYVIKHLLKPKQILKRLLTKKDCIIQKERSGLYFCQDIIKKKPLGKLGCNLARTVLIDDVKTSFVLDPLNGILIPEFNNPNKDNESLLDILKILDILSDLDDVRSFIPK